MVRHNTNRGDNMTIGRSQMTKQVEGKLRGARKKKAPKGYHYCLLYTSPSPRD